MFKTKLIELRKANNDTQESLALKLHVSRSLVAKWEQGRAYPSLEDLENIVSIYQISFDELMSKDELKRIYGIVSKRNRKTKKIVSVSLITLSSLVIVGLVLPLFPRIEVYRDIVIETEYDIDFSYKNIILLPTGEVLNVDETTPLYLNDERIVYNVDEIAFNNFYHCKLSYKVYDVFNGYKMKLDTKEVLFRIDLEEPVSDTVRGFYIDFSSSSNTNVNLDLNKDSAIYYYLNDEGEEVSNYQFSISKEKLKNEKLGVSYYDYLFEFEYDFDKIKEYYLLENEDKGYAFIPILYIYDDMTVSPFAPHNYLSTRFAGFISVNWDLDSARSIGVQNGREEETLATIESKYIEPSSPYKYQNILLRWKIKCW